MNKILEADKIFQNYFLYVKYLKLSTEQLETHILAYF